VKERKYVEAFNHVVGINPQSTTQITVDAVLCGQGQHCDQSTHDIAEWCCHLREEKGSEWWKNLSKSIGL
jgi:hypothetical protein